MSADRIRFFTIDPSGILEETEGHKTRTVSCRILKMGNCPDDKVKPCGACAYSTADQEKLNIFVMNTLDKTPSSEFRTDAKRKTSLRIASENGTAVMLTHNEGEVKLSRRNPPLLTK